MAAHGLAPSSTSPGATFSRQPLINTSPDPEQRGGGSTGEGVHHCPVSLLNSCHELFHTQIKFTQIRKEQGKKSPSLLHGYSVNSSNSSSYRITTDNYNHLIQSTKSLHAEHDSFIIIDLRRSKFAQINKGSKYPLEQTEIGYKC